MLNHLKKAMLAAGYMVFAVHEDPISTKASLVVVYQNIYKGAHPAFWDVVDGLKLAGGFGTQMKHQMLTNEIPHGVYLTFV